MFALHELHDIAEVIAMDVETALGTCQRQAAGCVGSKVTEIPSLDETAKSGNSRVLFQGTKRSNAELALVLQCDDVGIFELFFFF